MLEDVRVVEFRDRGLVALVSPAGIQFLAIPRDMDLRYSCVDAINGHRMTPVMHYMNGLRVHLADIAQVLGLQDSGESDKTLAQRALEIVLQFTGPFDTITGGGWTCPACWGSTKHQSACAWGKLIEDIAAARARESAK